MIQIVKSFLCDRKQRVTIDGKNSDWACVQAGVPQGSLLGPLLFLVYINNLVEVVDSEIRIFADDTFIFTVHSKSKLYGNFEQGSRGYHQLGNSMEDGV